MSSLCFTHLRGSQALPLLEELAHLRISIFQDFPYLYDGDLDYERRYLKTYIECPDSLVTICREGSAIVGASTAIPLRFEEPAFQAAFTQEGIDPRSVMYFGESLLLPAFRGQGAGKEFFHRRLEYARSYPGIAWASFCAVVRPENHPRRPLLYRPLDGLWKSFGFSPREGMLGFYTWKDTDAPEAAAKPMQYWLKSMI
jgi:hypothetical protein